ncbi:hypothetical protein MTP03_35310 [Tsukamurella sp. PLM1]|nr:hypothetical protein MTP03_35310 [Tsukamurella sp. PLM1]
MIVGGGGLLWIFAEGGWRVVLLTLGGLILLCTLPVVFLVRDERPDGARRTVEPRTRGLATAWFARLRRPGVLTLIGVLAAYKFGNAMASSIAGPFLHDVGLSLKEIAIVSGALSSAGALAGSAVGGWVAFRHGRRRALIFGGVSQTLAVSLYVVAALGMGGGATVIAATVLEHVFGGAALVAMFTLMMDACEPDDAGADYTLLASAVVATQGIAAFAGGASGDLLGYASTFAIGMVLSGIGCAVFVRALDRGAGPRTITTWHRSDPVPTP